MEEMLVCNALLQGLSVSFKFAMEKDSQCVELISE